MRRLGVQLLVPIVLVSLAFLLVAAFYWSRAFERFYVQSLTDRLRLEARLVADQLPWGKSGPEMDRLCRERAREIAARVTVIGADGGVLGESEGESEKLDNHGGRPEIVQARAEESGTSTRHSQTVGVDSLYVAIADRRAGELRFVRVAMPLRALAAVHGLVRNTLASGLAFALVAGGGAAWLFSWRLARRIRRIEILSRAALAGDSSERTEASGDELGQLERHLADLAREMRAQLAETEAERAKLEAVLRSMGDGLVVLDREGRVVLLNERARVLLDLPAGRPLAGENLRLLCRNADLIELLARLEGDNRHPEAEREVTFDGAERRVLSIGVAALTADGERRGAILVLRDVTQLRHLEAIRAEFVANVSHELRTPLTAIRGYAETLLAGALDEREKAVQFVSVIERHSQRLTRLITDLLTLSDLELGRAEVACEPLSAAAVVETAFEVLRARAEDKGIRLETAVATDLPPLHADRDRVEQVLLNLVDNAIKYSPAGATVRVSAGHEPASNGPGEIVLAIADTGIGIPEKDLPRLTERFYRVDRARSRELGGTGLGLAIVKHIVQAHGGRLGIESRVGEGTTVRVWLPVA